MGLTSFFLLPSPEEVVREHGPRVRALLIRMFGADVDDVFQNVFIEVLRSLPRFAGRSKLSTWIHRVALNVAYQEMRQRYLRERLTTIGTVDENDGADVLGDVARKQAAKRVRTALAALPPKQRLAVTLHDLEGLTLREIAADLGVPLQTVATRVRTGRARLADQLAELRGDAHAVSASAVNDEEGP